MKVLLLSDVKSVGRKGEIKDVANGFALNNLIPRRVAVSATPSVLKRHEEEMIWAREQELIQRQLAEKTFAELSQCPLVIKANTNEKGHLFASIHAVDIMNALKSDRNIILNPSWMELKQPIKEVGNYTIKLNASGIKGELNLIVE